MTIESKSPITKADIRKYALELGFQQCGVSPLNIETHIERYKEWLKHEYYGDMEYMKTRENLRSAPEELVPDTLSVISVRLNYVSQPAGFSHCLNDNNKANISRYALGRDYHKLMRKQLARFAQKIESHCANFSYRVFVDSAPVLERAFAEQAGLGWIGKNTMLINESAGSFFFLGEILTNLPLEPDETPENRCGECSSCIKLCPTGAIVAPYTLDARKCISYLTIEHFGSIEPELRPLMGNRIYGCDDCQLVCPWNRYAKATDEKDFAPRHNLNDIELLELFDWDENTFLKRTEGSPIRRIGFERWQRNLAIALGNADFHSIIKNRLQDALNSTSSDLVREHLVWAIEQQSHKEQKNVPIQFVDKKQMKVLRTTKKLMAHLD